MNRARGQNEIGRTSLRGLLPAAGLLRLHLSHPKIPRHAGGRWDPETRPCLRGRGTGARRGGSLRTEGRVRCGAWVGTRPRSGASRSGGLHRPRPETGGLRRVMFAGGLRPACRPDSQSWVSHPGCLRQPGASAASEDRGQPLSSTSLSSGTAATCLLAPRRRNAGRGSGRRARRRACSGDLTHGKTPADRAASSRAWARGDSAAEGRIGRAGRNAGAPGAA